MSDFDKEAEREKLREKYERDRQKREATEKMSELLLKGATMTNAHCSECGDPIFRYDDQEFCATCEKPVERGTSQNDESGGSAIEVTSPSDDARVVFGSEEAGAAESGATGQENSRADEAPAESQADDSRAESQADDSPIESQADELQTEARAANSQAKAPTEQPAAEPQTEGTARKSQHTPAKTERGTETGMESESSRGYRATRPETTRTGSVDPGRDEDLTTARNALVRTLVQFSQQAEATDDPQRAREYLQTAREAAETLSALPR